MPKKNMAYSAMLAGAVAAAKRDEDNGYYLDIPFAVLDIDFYIQGAVRVAIFGPWENTARINWQKTLNL